MEILDFFLCLIIGSACGLYSLICWWTMRIFSDNIEWAPVLMFAGISVGMLYFAFSNSPFSIVYGG